VKEEEAGPTLHVRPPSIGKIALLCSYYCTAKWRRRRRTGSYVRRVSCTTLVWMMEGAWCAGGGCMEFMFFSCCSSQPAAVLLLCPACLPA
jgi:hypothetical protein